MDGSALRELLVDFADVSKNLDKEGAQTAAKLCEIAKELLRERAIQFVKRGQGGAILLSYQSDSTPLLAKATYVAQLPDGSHVVRKAGRALELLLQKVFVKIIAPTGTPSLVCYFRDPVPLDDGKGTWPCFSAACECFPMLQTLGHKGISISHYCFDRALFSSLDRTMRQRHLLFHEVSSQGEDSMGGRILGELTDWVVSTPCANHDAQNGLKWGLAWMECGEETIKKLHIAVESLRNSYNLLVKYLPKFLMSTLTIVQDSSLANPEEFWVALGMEPVVVQELVELGLCWRDGRLQAFRSAAEGKDFMGRVTACILSVFRFKRFTDSRWCSMGDSCRTLLAAFALGLPALVQLIRSDSRTSDYYISGFGGFDEGASKYAVVASLVSHVCDGFLLALLDDDRVARRREELEDLLLDELQWLSGLSEETWRLLAQLLPGTVPFHDLRSWCVRSASIVEAFIKHKVLRGVAGYPWRLAEGDVAANLRALATDPGCFHGVTQKVKELIRVGYPFHRIVAGVQLLAEVQWTSTSVEQGHGSAATLHRLHKQYGANMLCQRSMLHMLRHLVSDGEGADRAARQLEAKEEALAAKRPQYLGGRQAFLQDFMAVVKESAGEPLSLKSVRTVMSKHSAYFEMLSDEDQAAYHNRALVQQAAVTRDLEQERQGVRAAQALRAKRSLAEQDLTRALLRASNCRFTSEDYDKMAVMWESGDYSKVRVETLRSKAMTSPKTPAPSITERLSSFDVSAEVGAASQPRTWVSSICRLRAAFAECALKFTDVGQEDRFFAFLYATQQPMMAEFLPIVVSEVPLPSPLSAAEALSFFDGHFDHTFTFRFGTSVPAADVEVGPQTQIFVLPHVSFRPGNAIVSHSSWVSLLDFVRDLMDSGVRPAPKAKAGAVRSINRQLVEEFPWLDDYLASERNQSGDKRSSGQSSEAPPKKLSLDDDEIQAAFDQLQEKREMWQVDNEPKAGHFKVTLLGGAWTLQHKGVACDSVKAFASGKGPRDWCAQYGLPRDATFSLRKFGDTEASGLALTWASRLDYFYSVYLKAKKPLYEFTDDDIAACPKFSHVVAGPADPQPLTTRLAQILTMVPKLSSSSSSSGIAR